MLETWEEVLADHGLGFMASLTVPACVSSSDGRERSLTTFAMGMVIRSVLWGIGASVRLSLTGSRAGSSVSTRPRSGS